jgi:hypothetical protein
MSIADYAGLTKSYRMSLRETRLGAPQAHVIFHGDTADFEAETLNSFIGSQSEGDVFVTSMAGVHGDELIPAVLRKLGNIFLYFLAFSETHQMAELGILKLRLLEKFAAEGGADMADPIFREQLPILFGIAGLLCRDTDTVWIILIEDFESLTEPEAAALAAAQMRILEEALPVHLIPYAAPRH